MSLPDPYRWVETNSPTANSRTDDIWFTDPDTGWLVNSNGQVCKTEDGGANWQQQFFLNPQGPARPYLRTIQFANPQRGWFGAIVNADPANPDEYRKVLLHHTEDGGATWNAVENLPEGAPEGICGLSVVDENVVYGSGSNDPSKIGPAIVKTIDGGSNWQVLDMSAHASNLIDIHFFDANRGWVVGGLARATCPIERPGYSGGSAAYAPLRPVVLYTEDGGATWEDRVAGMEEEFECGGWGWKLFWLDEQVGFISIENFLIGSILRTLDGGLTWQRFVIDDQRLAANGKADANANLEGIGFVNPVQGWVGGWGNANFIGNYNSYTGNGGPQWVAEDHISGDPASDVRVNVNRYRFFHDPKLVGYCSGVKVYKLTDEAMPQATALVAPVMNLAPAAQSAPGTGSLTFDVPAGTKKLYVGVWNHFGWHTRDLLDETDPTPGPRTVTWDGLDKNGQRMADATYFGRVLVDDQVESERIALRQ